MTQPRNKYEDFFEAGTGSLTDEKERVKEPPQYEVWLHNDNYTTMAFVVQILMTVFHKTAEEATTIMLEVHTGGKAIAGVYPQELAEIKVQRTRQLASEAEFPLRCTMQEAE